MSLPTFKSAPITNKTEGTSQTYGQLIILPTQKEASSLNTVGKDLAQTAQISTVSPKDTIVKIVPNEKSSGLGAGVIVNDAGKSKISIAAFSDSKQPSVTLDKQPSAIEQILEGSKLNSFTNIIKNDVKHAIVVGSLIKSKEEIKKVLTEAQKVDMMICMKSKYSEELEFNNLKEPEFSGEFTYNFFATDESDVISQEDQSKDPLLKDDIFHVPRYVELNWNAVDVTADLTSEEKNESAHATKLKEDAFGKKKGVVGFNSLNFKDSFEKSKKKTNLLEKDGIKKEVVDVHNLDLAFNSIANKNMFGNTINATFNVSDQSNVVSQLPIKLKG